MDNLVNESFFTIPLVLPQQPVDQASVDLSSCNEWHLKLNKEQSVPFVILNNGEFQLQNIAVDFFNNTRTEGSQIQVQNHSSSLVDSTEENVEEVEVDESISLDDLVETVTTYKCKLCNHKTASKPVMLKHLKTTHLEVGAEKASEQEAPDDSSQLKTAYMCGSCSEAFASFNDCRAHMAQKHVLAMGSSKAVLKEGKRTDDNNDLEPEEKPEEGKSDNENTCDVTKEKTLKCPMKGCLLKFSSQENLSKHTVCHSAQNPKEFICNYCSSKFSKWSLCATHLWRSHSVDIEIFSCSVCSYKTLRKMKMETHKKIHSDGKEFMCNHCGKMFSQKAQLCNHQLTHFKPTIYRSRWYMEKECDQCRQVFANSKSLKKHIQAVHSKLKPYVCQVCGHCSATKRMLQTHLRQHTGEKPFKCTSCSYSTADHNSLRRHRMRHTGVKPYKCPHCPYSSIQSPSFKQHLLTWHPTELSSAIFRCSQCTYSSISETRFQYHMAYEHNKTAADANEEPEEVTGSSSSNELVYQCLEEITPENGEAILPDFSSTQFTVVGEEAKIHLGGITIPAADTGNKEIVIKLDVHS